MNCFSFIFRRKRSHESNDIDIDFFSEKIQIYSYNELKRATDDFRLANKIGQGGFGSVYRGTFQDGKVAAIKVLAKESEQGAKEFLSELTTIANIVHKNLVKLHGCCVEGNHRILVYEYVVNNSLARTLLDGRHTNIQFNWGARTKICIGIAHGLAFLHDEICPHIIHRDIKASNILLDNDLTPKISDFGLAKLLPSNATHVSTRVAGTMGYLAPEYAISGRLTRKADIYSFGVLLLEIISGRCNTNTWSPDGLLEKLDVMHGILVMQTWGLYERNELVSVIDPALGNDFDPEEAIKFLKVGLLCTQEAPKLRPSMSTVVRMLAGEIDISAEMVTKPGLTSDFMNFKVRSQRKADEIASPTVMGSSGMPTLANYSLSSNDTTHASLTFTAICDRHA